MKEAQVLSEIFGSSEKQNSQNIIRPELPCFGFLNLYCNGLMIEAAKILYIASILFSTFILHQPDTEHDMLLLYY